jgi:hypothetical protein
MMPDKSETPKWSVMLTAHGQHITVRCITCRQLLRTNAGGSVRCPADGAVYTAPMMTDGLPVILPKRTRRRLKFLERQAVGISLPEDLFVRKE